MTQHTEMSVADARTHLSSVIAAAQRGEPTVVIDRRRKDAPAVAVIMSYEQANACQCDCRGK